MFFKNMYYSLELINPSKPLNNVIQKKLIGSFIFRSYGFPIYKVGFRKTYITCIKRCKGKMKEFEDALLDIALKNIDNERNRFKDIDTKAIAIITVVGVLITFFAQKFFGSSGNFYLLLLTSLSFLITILICASVITVKMVDVLSTELLIEDFKDAKKEDQIRGTIRTIAKAEKSLRDRSSKKANELKYAIFALGFSIFLLILYSLSTFI
jgi:hypothetical protein